MLKNKIFAGIGMVGLVISLFFCAGGMITSKKYNSLQEEKEKIINEFVMSDEWGQTREEQLEKAAEAVDKGTISKAEYNRVVKNIDQPENIEKTMNDSRLDDTNEKLNKVEGALQFIKYGAAIGTGTAFGGLITQVLYDHFENE